MSFKKGDRLICVDHGEFLRLKGRNDFICGEDDGAWVRLEGDRMGSGFRRDRFILAPEEQKPSSINDALRAIVRETLTTQSDAFDRLYGRDQYRTPAHVEPKRDLSPEEQRRADLVKQIPAALESLERGYGIMNSYRRGA